MKIGSLGRTLPVTAITALRRAFSQVADSAWIAMFRFRRNGRTSSLFANDHCIPKLDVAGSSPVSRSNKSITYEDSEKAESDRVH